VLTLDGPRSERPSAPKKVRLGSRGWHLVGVLIAAGLPAVSYVVSIGLHRWRNWQHTTRGTTTATLFVVGIWMALASGITVGTSASIHRAIGTPPRERWPLFPFLVGVFERALLTVMISAGLPDAGVAALCVGWIAVKSAGGWQLWTRTSGGEPVHRAASLAGVLGSAVSLACGAIGGALLGSWKDL
jgi:hypothetical protein